MNITGAWDCHAHVIGDVARYPLAPGRSYDPPAAALDDYIALLDRHAIAYGVLVQPSVYGFDNTCLLDALDQAYDRLFGIAVPPPDATPHQLHAMHRRGVRGVRCNRIQPGGLEIDSVIAWRNVLRELGWHIELQLRVEESADLRATVARIGVPVVIDHMGRPAGRVDPAGAAWQRLLELVKAGECYVKLSAPYRASAAGPPWRDIAPLAKALLAANPGACLWGSDWPHTEMKSPIGVQDLLAALADWCGEEGRLQEVLEQTPKRLFGGPPG